MPQENTLIGLSLSSCMRDILDNRVNRSLVKCVVSGTNHDLSGSHETIILRLAETYRESLGLDKPWRKARFMDVLQAWLEEGKLIQPRALGLQAMNIAHGHWAQVINFR